MKNLLSPEEKADQVLENFQGIHPVEPSMQFDSKMLVWFDTEFSARTKTPKWFWAAAAVILAINVVAGYHYSNSVSIGPTTTMSQSNVIGSYYFQGGNDWYSQ